MTAVLPAAAWADGAIAAPTAGLHFTPEAAAALAREALARKVGARGLRMILEDLMLDLMYHLPSQHKVREFLVTQEMVNDHEINFSSAFLEKAG